MTKEGNKTTTNFMSIHPVDVIRVDGEVMSIIFLGNTTHTSIVMGMMTASSIPTRTFDPRIIVRLDDIFDDNKGHLMESISDVIENTAVIRNDAHTNLLVSAASITNDNNYELFAVKAAQDDDTAMSIKRSNGVKFPIVKLQFRYIIDLHELIKFLCKTDKRVLIHEIFKYHNYPACFDDNRFYSIPTEDIDEMVYTFCENSSEPQAHTFLFIKEDELMRLRDITKKCTSKKAFILAISIDDALSVYPDISGGYFRAFEDLSLDDYVELPIYIFNTTKTKMIGKFLPVGDGTLKLITGGKEVALILAKYMIHKRAIFELFEGKSTPDPTEDTTAKEVNESSSVQNAVNRIISRYTMDIDEIPHLNMRYTSLYALGKNFCLIFENEITDILNEASVDNNQKFFIVVDAAKLLRSMDFCKMNELDNSVFQIIDYFYIIESQDLNYGFEQLSPIRLRMVYDANSVEISHIEISISAFMRLDIQLNAMSKVIKTYNGKRYYLRLVDDCINALKDDLCFAATELETDKSHMTTNEIMELTRSQYDNEVAFDKMIMDIIDIIDIIQRGY